VRTTDFEQPAVSAWLIAQPYIDYG